MAKDRVERDEEDLVRLYLTDIGQYMLRTKDDEVRLAKQIEAGKAAIDELTSTGALEDFTAGDQTQLDRELAQISSASQVDDELAKLKAEVGSGAPQKEIASGGTDGEEPAAPAASPEPTAQPAEETTES